MHRVKRAVIVAAGIGKRLRPVTLTTPKPLVTVNGTPMICTVIDALLANGIEEIYVVVGYLGEQFTALLRRYPGIRLIDNPYYADCNNISSLYMAREHLEDCMILDGDQIVRDARALSPEFERSGYNCVWTDGHTDEWLLTAEDGIVRSCSRTGGSGGWQLFSVSRWSARDGRRLAEQLELEFVQRKNRDIYWDDIPLFCCPEDYELGVREMRPGDIVEIDDIRELAAVDGSYASHCKEDKSDGKS